MAFGTNLVWRYPTSSTNPPSCQAQGIPLDNGYILLNPLDIPHLILLKNQIYHPLCYNGVPLLSTFKDLGAQTLPMISNDWIRFINNDEWGSFKFTVYSIIYSLTVATVMAIFLTIIVFTNHTQKPSWLLRLSSLLGSVNLTILFVRSIIYLEKQHTLGISSGVKLLDDLQSDQVFNAIDFIFVLLAQFAEVQVIIRLFSRAKEKRVSFLVGGALSLAAQIIWAVSTFSNINIDDEESNLSILPAFTYLLRIALSTVYSGLIVIYAISKRSYIFHRSVVLLTLLNFLVINLQIAFFVTDISNIWVSELSEIFNTTVYICVTVIPWEWINRVHAIERHEQKEGVLGRPFYEDEDRAVIRYEIIDDTELFSDDHGNNTGHLEEMAHHEEQDHHQQQQQQIAGSASDDLSPPSRIYTPFHKLKTSINTTTNTLLYLTDQVIAYGLAVPRSVSTDSTTITTRSRTPMAVVKHSKQSKIKGKFGKIMHGKNVIGDSSSGDSSSNNHHRKEVFVYSKREVVCDDLISAVSTNTSSSNSDSTSSVGTSGVMMDSHIAGNIDMEGLESIIYEDGSERR